LLKCFHQFLGRISAKVHGGINQRTQQRDMHTWNAAASFLFWFLRYIRFAWILFISYIVDIIIFVPSDLRRLLYTLHIAHRNLIMDWPTLWSEIHRDEDVTHTLLTRKSFRLTRRKCKKCEKCKNAGKSLFQDGWLVV
jgi:hypothetical protein